MKRYRYALSILVDVEAFSEDDAKEIIMDTFGPGKECGLEVTSIVVQEIND